MRVICTLRGTDEAHAKLRKLVADSALSKNQLVLALVGCLPSICRVCGCTEKSGCPEGCSWTDETRTLCSTCADYLAGKAIEAAGHERDQWFMVGTNF